MNIDDYTPEQARALIGPMREQLASLRDKERRERETLAATMAGIEKTGAAIKALEGKATIPG